MKCWLCSLTNCPWMQLRVNIIQNKKMNIIGIAVSTVSSLWATCHHQIRLWRRLRKTKTNAFCQCTNTSKSKSFWLKRSWFCAVLRQRWFSTIFLAYIPRLAQCLGVLVDHKTHMFTENWSSAFLLVRSLHLMTTWELGESLN